MVKQTLQQKVVSAKKEVAGAFISRDSEAEALFIALLSGAHLLYLGPPGTAKSMLVETMTKVITGATYFGKLMTKFTLPEELFGPTSVQGIKNDVYERRVAGYLPEAHFAFVDEVWKSNSSILNSLLDLMNVRKFKNGTKSLVCPLLTMVGASNELPESKELDALYDRFMLRLWVPYLESRTEFLELLDSDEDDVVTIKNTLTLEELKQAQQEVKQVTLDQDIKELVADIKEAIGKAGFVASDRRWKKALKLLKASAYLRDDSVVTEEDLGVLAHVLWKDPKDYFELARIITKVSNPALSAAKEILDATKEAFNALPIGKKIPDKETAGAFQSLVEANSMFKEALNKLDKLTNGRPNVAIQEVRDEVSDMSQKAARFAAKLSGLE